ncbi:hypothetical protein [Celeribacter litoreus]|uniref:hypothetical protein n=1 Tax=Celeribacter litoreus TaxID=2876714 RepID=UPI001CCB3D34|nr:hypothetical protein [Celeribacter litoreus]MCA0044163.1 hypothetical protein [Celeribacter litoreus]
MSFILLPILIGLLALPLVMGPLARSGKVTRVDLTGSGFLTALCATIAISSLASPIFGIGFILAVLIHEAGLALACRSIGHDLSRMRISTISNTSGPESQKDFDHALEDCFAALYGPVLAVVPTLLALGLFHVLSPVSPVLSDHLGKLAITLAAFNFLMLMPFRPLGGGRIAQAVSNAFGPQSAVFITLFMVAAFASAALREQSIAMSILTAAALQSLFHSKRENQMALSQDQTLIVMSCYAITLTVYFMAGFWCLTRLI